MASNLATILVCVERSSEVKYFAAVLLSSILSAKVLSNLVYIDNLAHLSLFPCASEYRGCLLSL
jgi:hypothetical protein